jgi:hypothetical protein
VKISLPRLPHRGPLHSHKGRPHARVHNHDRHRLNRSNHQNQPMFQAKSANPVVLTPGELAEILARAL